MTRIHHLQGKVSSLDAEEALKEAAKVIRQSGTVVFPTETVYGLGADGLSSHAVKKIYRAKGRPSDNPMILHVSSMEMLETIVAELPEKARALMDAFWPGPLTLVLEKSALVPLEATGGLETVAVRMPSHPLARKLIELSDRPIAAPSANLSGKPSPTTSDHVIEDLDGRVDLIIAADSASIGLESTVVDMTASTPVLLRPGSITLTQLRNVVGEVDVDPGVSRSLGKEEKVRSPGMKYRHYAPDGEMILVKGTLPGVVYTMMDWMEKKESLHPIALAPTEYLDLFGSWEVLDMGSVQSPKEIMNRLYGLLRTCNQKQAGFIVAPLFSEEEEYLAVNNRLSKAAGYHIVDSSGSPREEDQET